jgi:CPA1 family monovalent cation:H+ antiporter
LTLPVLIRKLGLCSSGDLSLEERKARLFILNTVLQYLENLGRQAKSEHAPIYEDMIRRYRIRLTLIEPGTGEAKPKIAVARYARNLSQELLALERSTAVMLRNDDKINDELLRTLERELDLSEAQFESS